MARTQRGDSAYAAVVIKQKSANANFKLLREKLLRVIFMTVDLH
jgi:hypothetical protein